jgi:transcriptional regulator with XRE-family HTH domain
MCLVFWGGSLLILDQKKVLFGKIIHEQRKKKKNTLKHVAERVGVSTNFISLLERGLKAPSDKVIIKLADVLEINEGVLFKALGRVHPSIRGNVETAVQEHEGLKELLSELTDKVKEEPLREELYEEVYNVYLAFLKRHNIK